MDDTSTRRVVVVGGPMRGKSTYARGLNLPRFCTDTRAQCRDPEDGVTYLPDEHAGWSESSQHVADTWLGTPGPWTVEGVASARALRKWLAVNDGRPCDEAVFIRDRHPDAMVHDGHERMAKGVATVWREIVGELRRRGVAVTVR